MKCHATHPTATMSATLKMIAPRYISPTIVNPVLNFMVVGLSGQQPNKLTGANRRCPFSFVCRWLFGR
jgi:hypothetical protein